MVWRHLKAATKLPIFDSNDGRRDAFVARRCRTCQSAWRGDTLGQQVSRAWSLPMNLVVQVTSKHVDIIWCICPPVLLSSLPSRTLRIAKPIPNGHNIGRCPARSFWTSDLWSACYPYDLGQIWRSPITYAGQSQPNVRLWAEPAVSVHAPTTMAGPAVTVYMWSDVDPSRAASSLTQALSWIDA